MTAQRRGFTLIELMVAISIVAILATIGLITYTSAQKYGRDGRRKQDLKALQAALELYKQANGHYPFTNNTWIHSDGSNTWLTDSSTTPATSISPTYINQLPSDPLQNTTNISSYGYHYWDGGSWGSCSQGQYYFLITNLENSSDSQAFSGSASTSCGTVTSGIFSGGVPGSSTFLMYPP